MAERMGVERESRVGRLRMGMVVVLRCAVLLGDVMVGRVFVVGVLERNFVDVPVGTSCGEEGKDEGWEDETSFCIGMKYSIEVL